MVWTDLIDYFLLKTGVLHVTEILHYFKIHQEYLLMKKKTPTGWSQIREAEPDKSHIESCKNPVWNAGQRDRALGGRVGSFICIPD